MKLEKWKDYDGQLFFNCEGLHDDYEGFRIILRSKDECTVSRVSFNTSPHLCYRNRDEGKFLKYGYKEGCGIFVTMKSDFIDWLQEETLHTLNLPIFHFAIFTSNDCIEVLSFDEPLIETL